MTLPLTPLPHQLSSDDVLPVELVQAAADRGMDMRAAMNAEHFVSGPKAGRHDVVVVPSAVAIIVPPSNLVGGSASVLVQSGFRRIPRWEASELVTGTQMFMLSFELPSSVILKSARAFYRWGDGGLNSLAVPRFYLAGPHKGYIIVGPVTDTAIISRIQRILLLVYGTRVR